MYGSEKVALMKRQVLELEATELRRLMFSMAVTGTELIMTIVEGQPIG